MNEQIRADLERIKQVVIPIGERIIELSKPILSKGWRFKDSANFLLTDDSVVLVCNGGYPIAFITKLGRLELAGVSVTSHNSVNLVAAILSEFEPRQIPTVGSGEVLYFLKKDAKGEAIDSPEDNVLRLSTPSSKELADSVLSARTELMRQISCSRRATSFISR